jgi:hypothetical protein
MGAFSTLWPALGATGALSVFLLGYRMARTNPRDYLDANDLVVVANEMVKERRDMERYLDVAGLEGEARDRVARMAPAVYEVEMGWYVARKL